jgi:hypothetical protein
MIYWKYDFKQENKCKSYTHKIIRTNLVQTYFIPEPPTYRHAYKAYSLLQLASTFQPPKIEVREEL